MAMKNGQNFNCKVCDKEFYRSGWDIKNGRTKYCSVECQHKGYEKKVELTCKQCKEVFIVKEYRKETANFCSRSCRSKWYMAGERHHQWKGGKPKCRECGKKLWHYDSLYCSEHKGVLVSGSNNYRWISDRTLLKDDHKDRGGQLHRDWSKRVKDRDGWKCKMANSDCEGGVEAHHILGWSKHPELRYELNNGITLYQNHHPRKRAEESRLVPVFQEMISVLAH